jgi:hypothetical protein
VLVTADDPTAGGTAWDKNESESTTKRKSARILYRYRQIDVDFIRIVRPLPLQETGLLPSVF